MKTDKDRGGVRMTEWLTREECQVAESSDEEFWRLYKVALGRKSNADIKKALKVPFIIATIFAIIAVIYIALST